MEFEKENDIMDQRQEMMDDAIDDVTGLEDEEEGEEVVNEVLAEVGIDLGQAVSAPTRRFSKRYINDAPARRDAVRTEDCGKGEARSPSDWGRHWWRYRWR